MSYRAQMWGWLRLETVRASRSKRWRRSGLPARCSGRTLIATVRSRRVSRARYTSPMPPAPSGASTSYGPSFAPLGKGMEGVRAVRIAEEARAAPGPNSLRARRLRQRPLQLLRPVEDDPQVAALHLAPQHEEAALGRDVVVCDRDDTAHVVVV